MKNYSWSLSGTTSDHELLKSINVGKKGSSIVWSVVLVTLRAVQVLRTLTSQNRSWSWSVSRRCEAKRIKTKSKFARHPHRHKRDDRRCVGIALNENKLNPVRTHLLFYFALFSRFCVRRHSYRSVSQLPHTYWVTNFTVTHHRHNDLHHSLQTTLHTQRTRRRRRRRRWKVKRK